MTNRLALLLCALGGAVSIAGTALAQDAAPSRNGNIWNGQRHQPGAVTGVPAAPGDNPAPGTADRIDRETDALIQKTQRETRPEAVDRATSTR